MPDQPTLTTGRLKLRPFSLEDTPAVKELAGAWEIAATTANIPHPYEEGMAEAWISTHRKAFQAGEAATFAIVRSQDELLVGAIGIHISQSNRYGEIGYWVGVPYWNQGYCTEAARAILAYGFSELQLNRIQARYMTKNPASGRVMQKIGMKYEGTLRQSIFRWGSYEDAALYSILRDEFGSEPGP